MLVDEPTVDYDYTSIAAEVRIARDAIMSQSCN